ncbi:MAG: hypothetical protein JXR76_02900 [Deltaproteobacteria bacterium]|nr:hypothetical protein [Deltaproteobacteria bacterium]
MTQVKISKVSAKCTKERLIGPISPLFLLLASMTWGCIEDVNGIACVLHSDCASQECRNGVCVGDPLPSSEETEKDSDSSSESVEGTDDTDTYPPLTDTYPPLEGVDILFVVDNSNSMAEEQQMLSTALYNLMNVLSLTQEMGQLDMHLGVTTTDMGVAYGENYFQGSSTEMLFSNDRVRCYGRGTDGALLTEYLSKDIYFTVSVSDEEIECYDGRSNCPIDWVCTNMDSVSGKGVCTPLYKDRQAIVGCPQGDRNVVRCIFADHLEIL